MSTDGALRRIGPGARVVATPFCATPTTLLEALAARAQSVEGIFLASGALWGECTYEAAVRDGSLRVTTWQLGPSSRKLAGAGLVDYLPMRGADVIAHVAEVVDVALIRVSPPDQNGVCSLGASASYGRALVQSASLVIAEVDPDMPHTRGEDVLIARDEIDFMVESQWRMPVYPAAASDAVTAKIADHVLSLVPRDPALQLGIGSVPEAITSQVLTNESLGRVTLIGLAGDAVADQLDSPRLSVSAVELLGSSRIMNAAHSSRRLQMVSSARAHDPRWLSQFDRLVSVCSALAVDLSGQVSLEAMGSRLVSGLGGAPDFFDGARFSREGLRCIALPSTTPTGLSRISPGLNGSPVSIPRYAVDVVVTEFGIAELRGKSLRERASKLIAIAHPDHRDELQAAMN